MSAVDETLRKFHASLNVSSLERSIAFYRVLLGVEPSKVRSDYAKFELAEPALVLSLIPGTPRAGGVLNHVGLRVRTSAELVEIQQRAEAAGLATQREEGVECCHATQTKFWITDPDKTLWEIYIFHDDVDEGASAEPSIAAAAMSDAAPRAWEHRLGEPIPAPIPHDDNSLHEVRCEGSINAAPDASNRAGLFADAWRALRPGGAIYLHGLSGDRVSRPRPALPGPAAAVEHVPATADVVAELGRAGFTGIQIELLSERAYFVVDGVPMRELRIVARKPGHRPRAAMHRAIYLGPMAQVTDDFGNVFTRGVATALNVHDWQVLSKSAVAGAFLLLQPAESKVDLLRGSRPAPARARPA